MAELFNVGGKRGMTIGIANDRSTAYGCAKALRRGGAELVVTYLNGKAEPLVLLAVSQMIADFPEIQVLDINPLYADENGVIALDARMHVKRDCPLKQAG